MSSLAFAVSVTWWSSAVTVVDASIRLRKNVRPGFTTVAAWFSKPIKERSSRLRPDLRGTPGDLLIHHSSFDFSSRSLCCGKRSSNASVSISIPRKVIDVADPSVLSSATGTPSSPHSASVLTSASVQHRVPG